MTNPRGIFDRRAKTAFATACVLMLCCSVGFNLAAQALNVYLRKERVEMRGTFATVPSTLGEWRAVSTDRVLDEAMIGELGTDRYFDRVYAKRNSGSNSALNVHLSYYTGMIDAVPHVPERCLVAAGLNDKTLPENVAIPLDRSIWSEDPQFVNLLSGQRYPVVKLETHVGDQIVRMPIGDFLIRVTLFEHETQPELRLFAGYFFIANGRVMPTAEQVKAIAFRPSEKYAYYCKVQFTQAAVGGTREEFLELVADFLGPFLPELMQRLPDWAEVERRGEASEGGNHKTVLKG